MLNRMRMKIVWVGLIGLIGLGACVGVADDGLGGDDTQAKAGAPAPMSAQQVLRTRELLRRGLSRSRLGLQLQAMGHGVQRMSYAGRFQYATIAVREPDGRVTQHCVGDAQAARTLLGME